MTINSIHLKNEKEESLLWPSSSEYAGILILPLPFRTRRVSLRIRQMRNQMHLRDELFEGHLDPT